MANAKLELFNSYFKELSSDEKELHKKRNERAKEIGLKKIKDAGGLDNYPEFREINEALKKIIQLKQNIIEEIEKLNSKIKEKEEGAYRCPNCHLPKLLERMSGNQDNDLD